MSELGEVLVGFLVLAALLGASAIWLLVELVLTWRSERKQRR